MNELISIIVPIYKVEKYLCKCVDSIINQTYRNLEIILIDDGSPDCCGDICDNFAQLDSRVKVIHKNNGGLSDARNTALDIFTGQYVTFVDSDDWLEKDYIEYLYYLIKKYNSDVSVCEFFNITEDGRYINHYLNNGDEKHLKNREALEALIKAEKFSTSAWGKLYKKELFDKRRYPKGRLFEDIPVTYDIFLSNIDVSFGARALYNYLYRSDAISKMTFNEKRMDAVIFVTEAMERCIEKYEELHELAELCLFRVNFSIMLSFDKNPKYKVFRKKTFENIRKYRGIALKSKESNKTLKKKALLSYLPYSIVQWVIMGHRNHNNTK